jgi:sugar (pentulose or hexulose) kinase
MDRTALEQAIENRKLPNFNRFKLTETVVSEVDDIQAGLLYNIKWQKLKSTDKLSCLRTGGTWQLHISPVPSGFLEESPEAQAS